MSEDREGKHIYDDPTSEERGNLDLVMLHSDAPRIRNLGAKRNNASSSKIVKRDPKARRDAALASFRACWRCKRYKKKCDDKQVCDACMTNGFRIWPSSLGCHRGNLHAFAHAMVPSNITVAIQNLSPSHIPPPSWRRIARVYETDLVVPEPSSRTDIWNQVLHSMRSTNIYGPGVLELIQIAAEYQLGHKRPNKVLAHGITALHNVLELYHNVVLTKDNSPIQLSHDQVLEQFVTIRISTITFMDCFLQTCLTGRLSAWLPSFLACSLGVLGSVLLADVIVALPRNVSGVAWPALQHHIVDLRLYLYGMARELLSALAKGADFFDMICWDSCVSTNDPSFDRSSSSSEPSVIRNSEGMRIVDEDPVAYDCMCGLAKWRGTYWGFLQGDLWMTTTPLDTDLLIVMSLARMFV